MSDKEQFEEIGRIVLAHRASAEKLAAIQAQLARLNEHLQLASKSIDRLLKQFEGPMLYEQFEGPMLYEEEIKTHLQNIPPEAAR